MKESEYSIKTVADNKEKWLSYKENFERFNKAKKFGFYLECLWILYSMIEDRTSSFLMCLGFTSGKDITKVTGCTKIKEQIRQIFNLSGEKINYNFYSLSGKLLRIKQVIEWSKTYQGEMTDYQKAVKKAVENLSDNAAFMAALEYLDGEWRYKRNQVTHALFNKDPDVVNIEPQHLVENGYTAMRAIDNAANRIKRKKIRSRFNIQ